MLTHPLLGRGWLPHHDSWWMLDRCELWNDFCLRCPPLTSERQEQIDDICVKSKDLWEKQAAARAPRNSDKPLKRPLHQPILISAGKKDPTRRRGSDRRAHDSHRPYDASRRGDAFRK